MIRQRLAVVALAVVLAPALQAADLGPAAQRFADPATTETPDFQRHVLPLMGRVGCNTRACHGSFQGQGDFRLSLFGYDFKADHEALMAKGEDRVDTEVPELSLIVQKPTQMIPHKGGKILREGEWAYNLLYRWLEAGAKPADGASQFDYLEVTPREIQFTKDGDTTPLKVVVHWADGSTEDVTCLTRFQTNDESIATVNADGVVACSGAGDTHVVAFYDNGVLAVPVLRPVTTQVGSAYPDVPTPTEIDRLVVEKLRKLGIVPSEICGDEEFLRRLSLDMTGSLPAPDEVAAFLADKAADKRSRKVEELLSRPTYAAWGTNRLCDLLGVSAGNFAGNSNASAMARNWYDWMFARVESNEPYDELMAGIVMGISRKEGQDYEDYARQESAYYRRDHPADFAERETMPYFWARRNVRLPEEKALAFSYAFLGVRLECAQCHKHPFDQWTQQDFNDFKAFFEPIRYGLTKDGNEMLQALREKVGYDPKKMNGGQFRREVEKLVTKGEVVPFEELYFVKPAAPRPTRGAKGKPAPATATRRVPASVLGGEDVDLSKYDDPRGPILEWMRAKDNPYFARAFVNRVWASYFGVGIIDPPDDSNLANPPSNAPLLDWLAMEFVKHDFDMKWLHRTIVLSDTYQRSWRVNDSNQHDGRNFSHALVRRLPAEVVIDAVKQATASGPLLAKLVADLDLRSFGPGATAAFGRGGSSYAERLFGRSARDTNCDCSRSDEPNLLQAIYLQNHNDLLTALERKDGWVAELKQTDLKASAGGTSERDELTTRLRSAEKRVRDLGDAPRNAGARKRLEAEVVRLRSQLLDLPAAAESDTAGPDVDSLVDQAFLRCLSRPPTAEEKSAARRHFEEAADPTVAVHDLLWALLNTKEFITNH